MTTVGIHKSALELHKLLERAVLLSYYDKFVEIGGDNVQQLRDSSDQDIEELINMVDMARKPPHVKRFKKALAEWKPDTVAATSTPADGAEGELHKLLRGADLLSYHDKFMEIGGDNVQQLRDSVGNDFQEVIDLVDMARKPFHVKRLKKALGQWTGQSVTVTSSAADESEGELHELLRLADLLSYHDEFIELGEDNVQQLCDSTDEEFQTLTEHLGMARKPLHVKRLKNVLKQWSRNAAVMTSIPSNESEREVHELLQRADLLAYYDKFIEKGVDNVQQLFDSTAEEFQEFMDLVGMSGFPFQLMRFQNELEQWTGHPATMTPVPAKKPRLSEIHHLLEQAGLLSYCEKFEEIGMDSVQELRNLTDEEFHEVINRVDMAGKPFHVKKLKKVLEEWTGPTGISRSKDMASTSQFDLNMERSPQWEDLRKEMHEAIAEEDEARVLKCLDAAPALKLWLDPVKEKSARYRAVKKKAIRIHGLLVSRGCGLNNKKESSYYQHLSRVYRAEIRRQRYYTKECKESYIYYLKSKSKSHVGCDDFDERLEKMFRELSTDQLNEEILKVVATAPHLDILFDYNSEDVQGITGCSGSRVLGLADYEKQRISIGGGATEAEVRGTFIHESCHLALHLVYKNDGKPYFREDTEMKRRYRAILDDIKRRENDVDLLIRLALMKNEEQEAIVRIPHILTQYGSDHGNTVLEKEVPELRKFFEDTVIPDMQKYIQNGIPSIDATMIEKENARLNKAFNIGKLNIKFENQPKNSVWENSFLHVVTSPELRLLEIMVHNAVQSAGLPYMFFDAKQLESALEDVLLDYKYAFALVTVQQNEGVRKMIKLLSEVSCVTGSKVILLVEDSGKDCLMTKVQQDAFFGERHKVHSIDEASFAHVTYSCKKGVFENSRVRLQGQDVSTFSDATNIDTFLRCVDTAVFLKLCESGNIDLGPPLHELEERVQNYYVEREFRRAVEINLRLCDLDDDNEAFALLGCPHNQVATLLPRGCEPKPKEELRKFEKFVLLQEQRDYAALLEDGHFRNKVVHLLKFDESRTRFLWAKSNGRLSHLLMTGSENYTEDALLNVNDKVVIVSAAPGMGKSMLASRLCTELKTQDKKRWVLYVDLPQRMALVKTASPSLGYLADLCQVRKDGLEFAFFEESLKNGSPFEVVVMLDGFDEVNDECRKCVLGLILFLANKKVYKVYLFTRTVCKPHVQDTLHTVSYDLIPFSDENQNEFLTRYRAQRETPATSNEAFLQKFEQLYGTLKKKNKTILETPLLLHMMAQMESGEITKSDDYSSLLNIVDISGGSSIYTVHIYKMFVEYKHLVHRKEKVKEDISRSAVRGDNHDTKSPFYVNHGLLAMKCIFPQDILKNLLNEDELEEFDPEGSFITDVDSFKEGFVNRINDGGIPEFVHKTFAEFFAAHYLLERAKGRKKSRFRENVVALYGKEDYGAVMMLFDELASASYPLHSAVMNNDDSYVEQVGIQREDMLKVDELKRTPLHVAALHSDEATLKMLPMDDELIKNDLFQMSPFEYVELCSPWKEKFYGMWWEPSRTEASPVQERLDVLCARCSEEAVKRSTQNLRRCETFKQKRHFLGRAIFTALIHDLRGVLDVYLSYVSPKESTVDLHKDIMDQLESRKKRSLRCSAEPSVIGNLDDFEDCDYKTAPFYAKSEVVCKMLLPYCDMGLRDKDGDTMLHNSANEGNLETTQFYLARISINERNKYFRTPLHLAKDAEMVKLLLPLYPSVNVLDYYQQTPMDICAKRDYLEAMKLLLLRTRIYDSHHVRLNTTLHVATYYLSPEAVTFLLPHANAHMLNNRGESCLDVAWTCLRSEKSLESNTVSCLIPHSIVNSPQMFGSSPLYVWARRGVRKVMQTRWPYLRHSDPRHAQRINRRYVDVNEDFQEEIWCLKLLFLHLDVITGDRYGSKLLHDVAREKLRKIQVNYINYMKMLVPPLNLTEQEKLRKIEVNYINYMKMLLPHLNLTEQDYVECSVGNDDIVTLYRRWSHMNNIDDPHIHDVNAEMVDDDGNTKLLIEAEEGNVEAVKIHLSPSSVCFTDEEENTALHLSARNGHTNVVKLLIPLYTSVDVINVDQKTPMHVCASNGHLDVVKLLLLRSRMSFRDNHGWTPLHWACESDEVDIVNFLLPHSFPNMRDTWGFTCCAVSAESSNMNILRCLIPHSLINCPNLIGDSPMRMCAKDYMREELVTLLPYCCDYDAASLLTIHPLSSCKDDTSMEAMPCLKLMVLHSDVSAVDERFCETLSCIREYYVESDSFWRPTETVISLLLKYVPLLLPHTNVSAKDDECNELLQGALRSSEDPELVSFLQKWTRLSDFHS
ncbi:uncharacterized protein LOC135376523 isoform X1 [Ornithodoros turicata]|uniref:uncharacterized protein LOC135376523 isoform X1 n=1 Tax=Ornithodoros turicata TaxID=34597 RepID=UPI003139267F